MRPGAGWHRNLGLKLLSMTLALCLWFYVHGIKVVERELVLPLRSGGLPDSLVLLAQPPGEARVLVSAQAQELLFRRFVPGAELRLDLAHARPPLARFVPTVADVHLGSKERLTLLRVVEPAVLELPVDRRAQRTLPVRVVTVGATPAGYALLGTVRATPEAVRCMGPATRLAALHDIPARSIDLGGKRGPLHERVTLAPLPESVTCEPAEVMLDANVVRLQRRTFANRPITILTPPGSEPSVESRPAVATLTLSGPQSQLDALAADDVSIVLDARGLALGAHPRVRLVARFPSWATLDGLEPDVADLTIHRRGRHR